MAKRKDSTVDASDKDKDGKRKKVPSACLFCRRSHMVCSAGRPCERCVRRGIAHLCTTESDTQPLSGLSSSASGTTATTGKSGQVARESSVSLRSESEDVEPVAQPSNQSTTAPAQLPAAPAAAAPSSTPSAPALPAVRGTPRSAPSLPHISPSPALAPTFPPSPAQPAQSSFTATPAFRAQHRLAPTSTPAVGTQTLLSLAATPNVSTPIHSPSWPALPPSFGLESLSAQPLLSSALQDHHPSAEWASLSSFIDSLDFPPGLFTPDVRSPAPGAGGAQEDSVNDREAYAAFLEQLRLKQTQLAASRPGSPRTQAFTHASSSFLQQPPQYPATAPSTPGAPAHVVPSKREFMELLQAQFESSQLAAKGDGWDWEGGWKALDVWLETCSEKNRERVYAPLRIFRPTVREIIASMSDEDKMLVEEGFQRLMLQYDRVFTVVKTPSCLWRRTGQIFKANAEFAAMMGMEMSWFKDGKLGVYELMTEEAGVNFWEQYCSIGFDQSRKAVLTTCTLTPPARLIRKKTAPPKPGPPPVGRQINCCFSFTVTRDGWGVPMGIMGNFLQL